jgi:DNA-binding PadR family transcriptional regulator
VNSGKFLLHGFRNRELRALLYGETKNKQQERRESSSVTRQLRMLRAHGVIEKVRKENRYKVTASGRQTIAALLSARAANTKKLLEAA